MIRALFLLLSIASLYSNFGLGIFLDDVPVKATVLLGDKNFTTGNGHLYIPMVNQSWMEVLIEDQSFNVSIPFGSDFCLYLFYRCDLFVFDSSGNRLSDFKVSINGKDLGYRSYIIAPWGGSVLKITTPYTEYCVDINVSAPTRISITLPVSDFNMLLTSSYGSPLKNQPLTLSGNNSINLILTTDGYGHAKLPSLPHGIYTMYVSGEQRTFLHNSSIKQKFTVDPVKDISVEIENSYLLFPTRVSVKLITLEDLPLPNCYVELEYDHSRLGGFTDHTGHIFFYIPPCISMYSDIQVNTSGINRTIRIYRNPAPLLLPFIFVGIMITKRLLKNTPYKSYHPK